MKVAVTSTGKTLDSPVDPRFGRAKNFIVFDTETGAHEVLDNRSGVDAAHGAGTQAAQEISRSGAKCVITGRCGPKAERALQAAGIEVILGATGTVAEMFEKFRRGELSSSAESSDPNGS